MIQKVNETIQGNLISGLILLVLALVIASCNSAGGSERDAATQPAGESPTSAVEQAPATATRTRPAPTSSPSSSPATDTPEIVPSDTPEDPTLTPEQETRLIYLSPEYGVQAFLWWNLDYARRDVEMIQDMGFGWVKQSLAWRDIEGIEKGKYDWFRPDFIVDLVEAADLKLLARIDRQPFWSQENDWPPLENAPPADLQDYGDFCGAIAERYRGRIAAYQVWNEPNLSREWGDEAPDPAAYTEMLKICYEAIKEADPEAIVISAGLAPTGTNLPLAMPDSEYLQGMYEAGAADYFDVLGLNAPGYKAAPEVSPDEAETTAEYGGGRWFAFRHVEDMRAIMEANGDSDKQVAILEMGWTTDRFNPDYAWHAVTEAEQADYLVRAYEYAAEHWRPWIGPMFTIYIADYAWTPEANEQWWWAITLPDGTPRPAYNALQAMEKVEE